MTILQISTGFPYSTIYKNMFSEFNQQDIEIEAYVPLHVNSDSNADIYTKFPFRIYSNEIIKFSDRILYFSRIKKMVQDIEMNFDMDRIELIHAHSLFSDGGAAYELKKRFNIPYIVAVRDTDMNKYIKKTKYLIPYARKILLNAEKIIFLSDSYRKKIINTFGFTDLLNHINKKALMIPNGISDYWLENIYLDRLSFDPNKSNLDFLFVGKVQRRKNIEAIINVVKMIENSTKFNVNLNIIGSITDRKYFAELKELGDFNYVNNLPKEELIKYYRKADIFLMPSLTETFGLVYAESMSQALPVIYTEDQGFDKQFPEGTVGYRVSPTDTNNIYNKINCILNDYDSISANCTKEIVKFDWKRICNDYKIIYQDVIKLN